MEKAKNTGLEDNLWTDLCMTHEMPWQKAWLLFENEVLQLQMASINQSSKVSSGHKSRVNATQHQPWSVGTNFRDRQSKSRAKIRVLAELEMVSGKELTKVESVLSSVISDLTSEPDFNETSVLSESTQCRLSMTEATIISAQKITSRMTKSINVASVKVLTCVTAILLPSTCLGANTDASEEADFCRLIGINRKSKYFKKGTR